ncbi:MAG: EF-P lysine aminoacylase GenX [Alphaproteobacteria bacterium]|nr:EF-P lysine aminoacylase GenX [Alphaproteobacteria bacterium]
MSWWYPHNFEKKRLFLEKRAQTIKAVRAFFDGRAFMEVETPALQVCPTFDPHIHGFKTDLLDLDHSHKKTLYLHTSPEFDMKKLLVAGMEKIYQICPVYRNAEGSKLHSPTFSLLEWYRAGEDYRVLMGESMDLLRYVADKLCISAYNFHEFSCDPFQEPEKLSVRDAFLKFFKIDLNNYINNLKDFSNVISQKNIRVTEQDSWDDVFHAAMAERIEPHLGMDRPTILYDYPVSMASLSRKKPEDPRYAERFELYVCGVELANAFSELTDAAEQHARFKEEMVLKKKLYGETYPADEEFFMALEYGMPESAGIALGVDRLVMLATGATNINDVLWAPVQV